MTKAEIEAIIDEKIKTNQQRLITEVTMNYTLKQLLAGIIGSNVDIDSSAFSNLLTSLENTTQKALEKIDTDAEKKSNKNIENGYAGLDSNGKLKDIVLPYTNGIYSPDIIHTTNISFVEIQKAIWQKVIMNNRTLISVDLMIHFSVTTSGAITIMYVTLPFEKDLIDIFDLIGQGAGINSPIQVVGNTEYNAARIYINSGANDTIGLHFNYFL